MKIALSADSTCDITKELKEEFGVHTVPLHVLLGEESRLDGELSSQEIFDFVDRSGILPKTSAVNQFQFEEHFESLLKEYDAIIHISISSGISSAYQNAVNAAGEFKNVYVIDSLSVSSGMCLLLFYAKGLIDEGKDIDEIVKTLNERAPKIQTSFVVNTLDYLVKGGRCSALAAFGANLLKLKPRIVMKDGKMVSDKKYRGKNNMVIADYCREVLSDFNNPDLEFVGISHASASPEMIEAATNILKERGFKRIFVLDTGCIVASHCGPKGMGILYINDGGK